MTATVSTPVLPPVADVTTWPTLTDLSSDASQRVFHQTMEAFSRPGTIHHLPDTASSVPAPVPAVIVPLLALADLMTPLAALSSAPAAEAMGDDAAAEAVAAISRLTGAPTAEPARARFALALDEPADFSDLSPGTHWSPEQGAMLVQRVAAISDVSDVPDATETTDAATSGNWRLTGPGVAPHADTIVRITGLSEDWLTTRQELVDDYPAGIDCLLVTDSGTFLALPRTTMIEVI